MIESLGFVFDGISSDELGLINIKIGGGMFEETFLSSREIIEEKTRYRETPYFIDVTKNPLEFDLVFAFKEKYTRDDLRNVARLFDVKYYKPFYFYEYPNRIYYVLPYDLSTLTHNGDGEGYITIKMRSRSPYATTPLTSSKIHDCSVSSFNIVDDYISGQFVGLGFSSTDSALKMKRLTWSEIKQKTWGELKQ